jgi:N-acetylglucosamine-6-phosphate deacetylase
MSVEITANIPGKGLAQIRVEHDRIGSVRLLGSDDPARPFVSPGLVDIQINGFAGVNFSDPDLAPEKAISVLPAIWKTGVTTFCPTLITNTIDQLAQNFRVLEKARGLDHRFARSAPCYHLEGPYLSPGEAHGAHDPALMRSPNWDEFSRLQEAAGGNIAIVTLAPELPGACDFIRRARAAGVIVALGHTDCVPEDIHKATEAGAELSTHLGNGCAPFIHRHQNPIWAQLASDQLKVSLICDGFHLPPDVVRVFYSVKGIHRIILITDAVHVANLPPGRYSLVGLQIELLPSGKVVAVNRQHLAGSALSMNRGVTVFQEFARVSLSDALQAATTNPGGLLRREGICTDLVPGQPANLVTFRAETNALRIENVLLRGEQVYGNDGPHLPYPSALGRGRG